MTSQIELNQEAQSEIANIVADNAISEFATYEDYLDSQITQQDLYYLDLVELGYRGAGDPIKRSEFESRKDVAEQARIAKRNNNKILSHTGKNISSPFLSALAEREEGNRSGKLTSIIFLRVLNSKGQEISGYIDYASRLKNENFDQYFNRNRVMMPKSTDLSFYNWGKYILFYKTDTQICTCNSTQNFQVVTDNEGGLLFKNKRDRKVINVDPKVKPTENTTRHEIISPEYIQIVIYDHITRRKS
ncbi:hypothetical protein ROZALSC1DRAFT_26428 [Rozella allomycis CSF55]|uniref:Cilia- and flagella-associated protein 299 n=1 Tax=Rozella allomycis (strain CSF55) TaxID=988480 RepID=A0A075AQM4_ROZAC|nr:hypothetical protein O9G_001479 [Rozella allomycis CSF55]RKP22185.1 hypothetical protein ROZALSC1DRAFT_26428 [Rozella allomycis CSF55]|eukprot:EPZ31005.1 hypothetical protein O9G_001479 [Rozella allomycis CSF55]